MPDLPIVEVIARYAAGFFPMDDDPAAPEIPWYSSDPRAVLELGEGARATVRRRLRRSLTRAAPGWELRRDQAFDTVMEACAAPRSASGEVWITPRLARQYARLHAAGVAHSFELWVEGAPGAGILAVVLGRAALLESMAHTVPEAGNVLLMRTLDHLAVRGFLLCDIQLPSEHTLRLGAQLVDRGEFERRLREALSS